MRSALMLIAAAATALLFAYSARGEDATAIAGYVLEAETEAPLKDCTVKIYSFDEATDLMEADDTEALKALILAGHKPLAEVRTDAHGRFRYEARVRTAIRVSVVAPSGWLMVGEHSVILDVSTPLPDDKLLFHARRGRHGPARLRFVERHGGRPVAHFHFEISPWDDESSVESLVTDGEGRVTTQSSYVEGRLRLKLIDHPALAEKMYGPSLHRHLSDGMREYEVAIDTGPTYRLDLKLPDGLQLQDLVAELSNPQREKRDADRARLRAPVREGPPPWVRFHQLAAQEVRLPGTSWLLWVSTKDGRWSGSGKIDWLYGEYRKPVTIEVRERGSIQGRVSDAHGAAVADARIRAVPGADEPLWVTTGDDGIFRFDALVPGSFALTVISGRHLIARKSVDVIVGSAREVEFTLVEPSGPLGLSGQVVSAAGRLLEKYERPPSVSFRSVSRQHKSYPATVRPAQDQEGVLGTFVAEDLPPDEYILGVYAGSGYYRWTTDEPIIPPADDVRIVRRDDQPTGWFGFRVYDATTGEAIGRPNIGYQAYNGQSTGMAVDVEHALIRNYPLDAPLEWSVAAKGYAPAFGDMTAFTERVETDDGPIRIARVALLPGWGARYLVSSRAGEPLEGVAVLLDGHAIGSTDASGRLEAYLPEPPGTVEFSKSGWRRPRGTEPRTRREIEIIMVPE